MSAEQIIFLVVGALIVGAALMVVTTRNLVHAALWLIVALFGVGVVFMLLNAGFMAVVQVVVYIGAIAILFIFAVMLTRKEMRDQGPQLNKSWWLALVISLGTLAGLVGLLIQAGGLDRTAEPLPAAFDSIGLLGNALVQPDAYVLPFEVASVLLLAALVGAVYIAYNKKEAE
jgi:NADH-quinone oxidoreductase subunit J